MAATAAFRLLLLPLISPSPSLRHSLSPSTLFLPPSSILSRPLRFASSSSLSPTPIIDDSQLPATESDSDQTHTRSLDGAPEPQQAADSPPPVLPCLPSPQLSVKEKKELASYAHSLGKKLKTQQVGKSGVTPSVAAAFVEALESKELLKLKVHGSCPGELSDVIKQLEEATGSVAVGQIGRSVILYRPSLSKMKKKEAEGAKKVWTRKPTESSTTFEVAKKWKVRYEKHQMRHA